MIHYSQMIYWVIKKLFDEKVTEAAFHDLPISKEGQRKGVLVLNDVPHLITIEVLPSSTVVVGDVVEQAEKIIKEVDNV